MEINSETIINFYRKSKPRVIFEMDYDTWLHIRTLKDSNHTYLWSPESNHDHMPGKLLGIDITIAKEKCFQLRYIFSGNRSIVETLEGL